MKIQLDFLAVLAEWPLLLTGVGWTLRLTFAATVVGVLLGIACAWVRARGFGSNAAPVWLKAVVGGYVELIRNTPFIVQLFFIFFGLPAAGIRLSAEWASFLAMTINLGAYAAEIIRAGIEATPKGQIEAALSLAMSQAQTFFKVVLPPALKKVAQFGQPNHHCDAGLVGVRTNFHARTQLVGRPDTQPKVPRL
jgi:polar amino acid transport system permease protein